MNHDTSLLLVGFQAKKLLALVTVTMLVVVTLPVMAVFAMGGPTLSWLAGTPDAKDAEVRGFYMGGHMDGNTYSWGNCTWWAYAMRTWAGSPIPTTWGNANTWDDNALRDGYIVNQTPAVGAVFQTDDGAFGHVAYVIAVDAANGNWTISEMNAPTLNVVSTRTFPPEAAIHYRFIHTKPGDEAWVPVQLPSMPSLHTAS